MGLSISPLGDYLTYISMATPGIILKKSTADVLDGTPIVSVPVNAVEQIYSK